MSNCIPIILAGGSGSRLWPLSRQSMPKQFLRLAGEQSLFQATLLRAAACNTDAKPLVITNADQYFHCVDQIAQLHQEEVRFLLEPVGRNTAPAIALAAHEVIKQYGQDVLMLVMPSDHVISDNALFAQAVTDACALAADGKLVALSVTPTTPATGYGYIRAGKADRAGFVVDAFVEKPPLAKAQAYVDSCDYYWNAGIFVLHAQTYLDELERLAPKMTEAVSQTYAAAKWHNDYAKLDAELFAACESESIDYAVMEKTDKAMMVPLSAPWSDLGSWDAVCDANPKDENGNVIKGDAVLEDVQNCYLHAEEGKMLAVAGLHDHVVVSTHDATLVAHKNSVQSVKQLVEQLKSSAPQLVQTHNRVYRPWGFYESLIHGDHFQVKHIMVKPGASLSLQLHHHRAEHWVVVEGDATVVCGEQTMTLQKDQSTYVPKETKHRLTNHTDTNLHIVEVQSGDYLGEDDIVRFEDIYGRDQ
jgi:mannose-1-phosphate guanylyltransferase/mannose-6-phosphate isomerase